MAKKQVNNNSKLSLQALASKHATHTRTSAKNGAKAKKCAYINATIDKGIFRLQLQNATLASKQLLQALEIELDGNTSDNNRKRIDVEKMQLLLNDMQASVEFCAQYNTFFDMQDITSKQAKLQASAKAKAKATLAR